MPLPPHCGRGIYLRTTRVLGLSLLVISELTSYAAPPSEAAFQLMRWQRNDGLPDSTITAIAQTSEGFLWLGTPKGLVRFDGAQFKLFGPADSPLFEDAGVSSLVAGPAGILQIGTESGQIIELKGNRFSPKELHPEIRRGRIMAMAQDKQGVTWAIAGSKTIGRIAQVSNGTSLEAVDLPTNAFTSLVADAEGCVWGRSEKGLLSLRNGHWASNGLTTLGRLAGQVIVPSHDGGLLLTTGNWWATSPTLLKVKEGHSESVWGAGPWIKGSRRSRLAALLEDKSGCLWFGTSGGGVYYARAHEGWQLLTMDGPLSHMPITCLYEDREGSIWIGTEGGGLFRARPKLVQTLFVPPPVRNYIFQSVCASHDGGVWAGTDGAGVFRYNGSEFKPYGGKGDAANLNVNVILEDTHTNVWIGSAGGFWRINGNQIESAAGPEPVMKNVQVIFEDRSGRLWLGSRNSLACQNRGIWERIRDTEGIIHSDIRSVAEDSHGAIWAAAYGQGLYRITEMQAELIGTNHARGLAMACALHIDRDGTLWIGAFGGGLMRYKDGAFTLWTSKDGLIGDEILALAEDDAGTLWMSSNQGIFGCSKLELEGHVLNGNLRLLCRQLLPEDGLSSLACSGIGQPAATRASDGKLWLCNNDALAVLDAGGRRKKVWPAPVLLDEVRVDNVPQALGDLKPLRVRASARRFEFHFTSPQVNSARGLLFRYQLEGMDSGWVDAGPQRERVASYSQLPYGNYRFRVMAGDEAAGWRELIPPLSLEITPRWWQSLWFRILGALSLIAAAGGAAALVERRKLGLRLRKLEMQQALENERRRIARDLHDDLGSQMTEIVLMGELAKRGDQTSNELSAQVRNLTQRIRELVTSMGDTVWTINPRNDSLPNLAAYLCDHAERFLSPTRVSCRLDVAEELPDVMLASQTRQNVFLVVKEALNNAVKHSDATTVSLRLWIQDGLLKIEVQDNGMGFDVHQPGVLGNGLNNIRIRMENLGGRARITSETGQGTTVYLEMPLSLSDGSRPKVAAEEAREDL